MPSCTAIHTPPGAVFNTSFEVGCFNTGLSIDMQGCFKVTIVEKTPLERYSENEILQKALQ